MPHCRRCGKEKPLIDAHIIPRSFYPEQVPQGAAVVVSRGYPRRVPIGVYDKGILCAECDGELGQLDAYAATHLLRAKPKPLFGGVALTYPDADPIMLRRFVASVAWRSSISSHEMFHAAKLGPYEESALRIADGEPPGRPIEIVIAEFDVPRPPFLGPFNHRLEGVRVVMIYASRFVFYVKTDRTRFPDTFARMALRPGAVVHSIVRPWDGSNEKNIMRNMVFAATMDKTLRHWGWQLPLSK